MTIRFGRRKLHVTTDEIGINLRWVSPPMRDQRVIEGEFVVTKEAKD